MLRIQPIASVNAASDATRVLLVGQVSGRWVEELGRVCADVLNQGRALEIDMAEVSFVDGNGLTLFRRLQGPRVALVNCALFVAEQLKTLAQDV